MLAFGVTLEVLLANWETDVAEAVATAGSDFLDSMLCVDDEREDDIFSDDIRNTVFSCQHQCLQTEQCSPFSTHSR